MKKILQDFIDFFSDKEDVNEPHYDPLHIGAMIIIVLFAITLLFWLLWSILVFGGGIQAKILPFLTVLFTSKNVSDFGYIGYPYEMGIFEGWVTNTVAFSFLVLLIFLIWYIFNQKQKNTH
ncbi:hypothetical protein ACFL58_02305 [Elusimicrobiota bacterium]